MDTAEIILTMEDNPLLDGVTLTGGDPFCQPEACLEVARAAHKLGLNVWAYSGWTYEQLLADPKSGRCWRKRTYWVTGPSFWPSAPWTSASWVPKMSGPST